MARLHGDLEQLQTSYGAFRNENEDDHEDDDEAPPSFQRPQNTTRWLSDSTSSRRSPFRSPHKSYASPGQGHDQDPPTGGVIIHTIPEENKSKWSHIEDLDAFFKNVYQYHQKSGFQVMVLQKFFELVQVIFILFFTVYLFVGVDYDKLFHKSGTTEKVKLNDVLKPISVCLSNMSFKTGVFMLVGLTFWLVKLMATFYQFFQFWDISNFFSQALHISDGELESLTWREVQKRLVDAQKDHQMCIHKDQLTDLDIYHRILRFKNYLVSMVNKDILPLRLTLLPCLPSFMFLSHGLKFNLEWLFFKGPWAAFDKWHLKDDYKKLSKKKELTESLKNRIALLAMINLLLMPLIFLWQILYCFFNYAEVIKREPGSLGVRKWSQYGKLYLRHLNELDHELRCRLNKAYKPANQYMEIFVSPMSVVIARFVAFLAGSVLAVFVGLSVWDEDVLNVEHVLTIITCLGGVIAICRVFLPDENMIFCPEKTLTAVLAHIHYFPIDNWKGRAHTYEVMSHLNELFPYTAITILEEIVSPIVTPFVLYFMLRPRASSIVDFFRNFTVDVTGVGDVCSFAQMDVRRHGNPTWQQQDQAPEQLTCSPQAPTSKVESNTYTQGEAGKIEMSLINFTLANPHWQPPPDSADFIQGLRTQATHQMEILPALSEEGHLDSNPLYSSLTALENVGGVYAEVAQDLLSSTQGVPFSQRSSHYSTGVGAGGSMMQSIKIACNRVGKNNSSVAISGSIIPPIPPLQQDLRRLGLEYTAADMSLSALFLHEMHQRTANVGLGGSHQTHHTNFQQSSTTTRQDCRAFEEQLNNVNEEESMPLVNTSNVSV